jgi:hypothetical protein
MMTAAKCRVCGLPFLSRPQGSAEGIRGFLSNSGDDHIGSEVHYVLRQMSTDARYAINKDDLELSDTLHILSTFQGPIDPDYKPPEGGEKTLTTGINILLHGPGNSQKFQVLK